MNLGNGKHNHLGRHSPAQGAFAKLRGFVRQRPQTETEICELCSKPIAFQHQHLLELEKRRVTCACDACAILFGGNARQRYRRIPRDLSRLDNFLMDDHEWESLLIPINLAFFVHDSTAGRVLAQYPSPGGIMESALDLEYWNTIAERNPILSHFEPDVEALLVNRLAAPQYLRAPIDQCFRLAGIIRTHWRGFSGGTQVWREVDRFFASVPAASTLKPASTNNEGCCA